MIRYMNYEYMCQSFGHMHRIKYRCNSILQSAVDMVKKIVRGSIKIGGIEMNSNILLGIMIPFIGTTLGSAMVFFMKKEMNVRLQKMLLGFASGVMIAASVWSLLIPAIDRAGGRNFMDASGSRLFIWNGFSSCFGYIDPTPPLYGREAGRSSVSVKKNDDACPCGNAS